MNTKSASRNHFHPFHTTHKNNTKTIQKQCKEEHKNKGTRRTVVSMLDECLWKDLIRIASQSSMFTCAIAPSTDRSIITATLKQARAILVFFPYLAWRQLAACSSGKLVSKMTTQNGEKFYGNKRKPFPHTPHTPLCSSRQTHPFNHRMKDAYLLCSTPVTTSSRLVSTRWRRTASASIV